MTITWKKVDHDEYVGIEDEHWLIVKSPGLRGEWKVWHRHTQVLAPGWGAPSLEAAKQIVEILLRRPS